MLALVAVALVAMLALVIWSANRPTPHIPLPNPNGFYDFVIAGSAVTGDIANFEKLDQDGLHALILTNAEPLRQLRLGLTHSCSVPTESWATNSTAMMNELPNQKKLARLLLAEGRLAELENRPADAARSYLDAMRLGNEISRGGFIINRLVGLADGWIGITPLLTLAPKLKCDQATPLIAELEKLDADTVTWNEVLQNENFLVRHELRKTSNPIMWITAWWQSRPAKKKGEEKHKLLTARLRLLTTELALRCYQSQQGHGPERLDQLIPKHLKRVPLDPFSDKPLVYRSQGTNWLLYSIGADKADDGGKSIGRSISGTESKGDLLYDSPR
ncbi:MAG: hypothetical protein JWQ71_3826 [Pedosphaera sp.]|nr:hypothetical protein [Pedosphaera sp.]